MRRCQYIVWIAAALSVFCGISLLNSTCLGAGVPAFSLRSMIEHSSVIVVAKVGPVRKIAEAAISVHGQLLPADVMQASARVKYVLKGSVRDAELRVRFSM